jgi:hypothetical protein
MTWSGPRRATAIAALSVAVLVLALANLVKGGYITWEVLGRRKDALAAAASVTNILVVLVGAVLSYFRFFRGRTFSTRADLDLSVEVIPLPNSRHLHAITFRVKNMGSMPIWDPRPIIEISLLGPRGREYFGVVSSWYDVLAEPDRSLRVAVLDPGETGTFATQREFDSDIWVVTYAASVSCDSGDVWKHVCLVRNAAVPAA